MSEQPARAVELQSFFEAVFEPDDIIEIRRLPQGRSTWHVARAVDEIYRQCLASNDAGHNIYVGGNPRPRDGARGDACIAIARCCFVDFDGDHLPGATTPDEQIALALRRIADAGLPPPTLILHSGGGVHAYWRLETPMTDLDAWSELQDAIITMLGTDRTIKNPERIMRVVGMVNHKRGRRAALVSCDPDHRVAVEDIGCVVWHANVAEERLPDATAVDAAIGQKSVRTQAGPGSQIITAFNAQVRIGDLLSSYGYDVVGSRFRRPGKDGRDWSGIIRDDRHGRRVSCHWSTNDKLNDLRFGKGRTMGIHDAFDVFCLLSHSGNLNDAVKDAAQRLGIGLPKQLRDGDVLKLIAASDDAAEFETLWFGETANLADLNADARMTSILAKHTTNPKQIIRLLDSARRTRAKGAA